MWKEAGVHNSGMARRVCGVYGTSLEKLLSGASPMSCPRVLEGEWAKAIQIGPQRQTKRAVCLSLGNRQLWEGRVRAKLWGL